MAQRHERRVLRRRLDELGRSQLGAAIIVSLTAGAVACQDVAVSPVAVMIVDVRPSSATIVMGETQTLTVVLTDDSGNELKGRSVVWSTENDQVAAVDDAGVVSAMGVGTTRITATAEGRTGEATITVEQRPVASVAIDPEELSLPEGGEETIRAIVRADNDTELADREVSWSSEDEDVVEVNAVGGSSQEAGVRARTCPRGQVRCTAQIVASAESVADTITVTVRKLASGISITAESDPPYSMSAGATMQLAAKVESSDGTDLTEHVTILWTSSVPGTAEVSPGEGVTTVVTANEPKCVDEPFCTAGITAAVDGVTDQVDVQVAKSVASVRVVPESVTVPLLSRHEQTFTATPLAEDGVELPDRSITWASTSRGELDSPCGEGAGPARVTLSSTTGTSTTVTVRRQLFGSMVWIWAETEGVVGCASLQIGS